MDEVRDRLAHVLWIGGAPCVGKTTLARMLAGTYDLKIYNVDWHHSREHRLRPGGVPQGWDERWVRPSAQALAERQIAVWTGRFRSVVEDLLALPSGRTVVAEGPSALPWCISQVIRSGRQAIFLLPTPELRESVLARRHRDAPGEAIAAKTSDPELARRNIRDRDVLLAQWIVASCQELGLRHEEIDGSRDLDDSVTLLAEHFGPHLPEALNV